MAGIRARLVMSLSDSRIASCRTRSYYQQRTDVMISLAWGWSSGILSVWN